MKKILIQFDTDPLPSSFDRVVAVDSDVDQLFSYGGISPQNVLGLVHGAIFTRGPADLKNTAVFIGGSDVRAGEQLATAVRNAFFGPMTVSVMMDSNGCNTTAAAAVAAAKSNLNLTETRAVVLGGTGPVGQRVAELLALEGADVSLVSRSQERANAVCDAIRAGTGTDSVSGRAASSQEEIQAACSNKDLVVAAGAAGVCFLPEGSLTQLAPKVAIDLNAVPPTGIADIKPHFKNEIVGETLQFGALGVGGTKMKVHKEAIRRLFGSNDVHLGTREIYEIALEVAGLAGNEH